MKRIYRRMFRERRRLGILAVLAALSGYLYFQGDPRAIMGLPLALVVSLGFAAGLALLALVSALLVPLSRSVFETYGVTMLLYALLSQRFPVMALETAPLPILNMSLFLVANQAVYHLMYGEWLGRRIRIRTHVDRATTVSTLDREVLWQALTPSPQNPELYAEEDVELIEPVPDERDTLRIVKHQRNGTFREQILHLEQVKPGWAYRASYRVTGAEDRPADPPRRQTLALDPRDGITAVHIRWERQAYPFNRALLHWIDDWAGRRLDAMVNCAEAWQQQQQQQAEPEPLPAE